jgi:hypothetical protein
VGPLNHVPSFIKAAITRPDTALEDRGTIIVLIDQTLVSSDPATMNAVWAQVQGDLVADGWAVVRYKDSQGNDAPRHNFTMPGYKTALQEIKSFINGQPKAKGILIIGHVMVPYSGLANSDHHPDHVGAWAADMYYGEVNANWTDTSVTATNSPYSDEWNTPGDGKFDQDSAPSALQLFVGRVDFAGLSSFLQHGTEQSYIKNYFQKAHNYRNCIAPFPLPPRGIVYNDFSVDFFTPQVPRTTTTQALGDIIYENALRSFAAIFPNGTNGLDVGDAFWQTFGKSYTWGFLAGAGQRNCIGDLWPSGTLPYLQHKSSDLQGGLEPQVGFYTLLGSYFGDWNLSDDFLRSAIAKPNYGLVATHISGNLLKWAFHGLGLGETIGECAMTTINNALTVDENARWVTILGDPTLRLYTFKPPSGLSAKISGNDVSLSWSLGDAPVQHVYRGPSVLGPFTRIKSSVPGVSTSVALDVNNSVYMIRGVLTNTSGCGSFGNLSQGTSPVTAQ